MLVACWSAKGGSGTTVVAVALALHHARSTDVLLVDLAGDVPGALGLPEPDGPGLTGWLSAPEDVPADALARLEVPARPGLSILPRGSGPCPGGERLEVLAALLASGSRPVIADCGLVSGSDDGALPLARAATHSLLVTRACYLSLRRAVALPRRPSGIVLVTEPGRALQRTDVEEVVGAPVRAEVALDPAVARAVDAGRLASREPRGLVRAMRRAA